MSPAFHASARYWVSGIALAAAGVVIARLVAPAFEARPHAALALFGELTALAGLYVIVLGIRHRLRLDSAATENAPSHDVPPATRA
jgi:uncharacterized membrane protein YidH (DUF202 family)